MLNLSHSNTTLRLAAILALCAGFTPFAPAQTAPSVFSQTTLPEVVRRMDAIGIQLAELSLKQPTLDDVFLAITGHAVEA